MSQETLVIKIRKKIGKIVLTARNLDTSLLIVQNYLPKKRKRSSSKKESYKNKVKKSLMATWEDLDKLSDDETEEEEEANLALIASAESDKDSDSESDSNSEGTEEVPFSHLVFEDRILN
ncbi:hypothetical protein A2U01_0008280 [Trifolium medium]|uniref:Uncharacterized protein n=1 Tax=Trifolium medium TaxID=97028 RepID=A0A392MJ77_9FABA|nr:hypothetical protein [Trifolium medium]